jgi:hypothetical protein
MHSAFYLTGLYIRVAWRVSYKKHELLTLRDHLSSPPFFSFFLVHFLSFLCCPIMCLYVLRSVVWYPLRFPHKTMFGSSLPLVVCSRAHVLFTLFVFVTHSGVQHIFCCVFVLIFFVLYTLCCHFFLIVHVW